MRKIDLTNFTLATSETARQINRRIALNFIRLHQPMSRADLARQSGLQRSTVSAIVDQLIDEGWVTEGAVGRSPRGRRPRNLHLNVERAGILGVELRPETTTIGLAGVDARFMGQATFPTAATPEQFVEDLAAPRWSCGARIRACCARAWASACPGASTRAGVWCSRRTLDGGRSRSRR